MPQLRSYPKVYNFGHRAIVDLMDGPVVVQEKVDGSQFSAGVIDGKLHCRSHHNALNLDEPPKMFREAVVGREMTRGLPKWYKERMVQQQFSKTEAE